MTERGWRNWSGLAHAEPRRLAMPADADAVAAEVVAAREAGGAVKMVGTGHSFTPIAAPADVLLLPTALTGIRGVDTETMAVTVAAGTPLHRLNAALKALGLSLHNMGDIDRQTVAGAISTGTHGTGGAVASLSGQVVGVELVTGTGELLRATPTERPDVFAHARLGLGALGVLTAVTFAVEPVFVLAAEEVPMPFDEALDRFEELLAAHDHVDAYWFPHTDRLLTKRHDRTDLTPAEASPLPAWRARLEDDLLANTALEAVSRLGNRRPGLIPRMNRLSARLLGARSYSDVAHRVFTSRRDVVFREMEYAVPRAVGPEVLREARRLIERSGLRIGFPVEVRTAPADDVPLSTAYRRDSVYLAVHTHAGADHRAYFDLVEPLLLSAGGRPHWGKLHSLDAEALAERYDRFDEFVALRDRLDPDRVFGNDHLERILGP